jgi:hypothetical protein
MFAPISLNVNWYNQNNWVRTKHLYRPCFQQVHLTAVSSDIGLNRILQTEKTNWWVCHFNLQIMGIKGVFVF